MNKRIVENISTKIVDLAKSDMSTVADKTFHFTTNTLERSPSIDEVIVTKSNVQNTLKDYFSVLPDDFVEVFPNLFRTYYKHVNSNPVKSFKSYIDKRLLERGLSTKPYVGNASLKSNYTTPIGTSGVGDCAVIFMYNSKKKIHALFHAHSINHTSTMELCMKEIMPEGFDRIIIIPGANEETKNTASRLFVAAKNINKDAIVEFKHSETPLEQAQRIEDITGAPLDMEFISYCGDVYQMPMSSINKPLFKIKEHFPGI